jgi:tRNA A-37 threonylcarbamoyl transferase component Bud32
MFVGIDNRYKVEREVGHGATAIVYAAHDAEQNREVALKVLRRELVESVGAERFKREIDLTSGLDHPSIVPVLGWGMWGDSLFFVLPFMNGGTLRERLENDRQLPIADVIAIGVSLASALQFAHERNLLHRDVKPENILFRDGQACLSDFGIARATTLAYGERTTSTGLIRGTPAYMSPEQASGEKSYDGRSDVYSLACVLYEALAGVQTFIGATPQAILQQRMLHEPRPIRVYRPSVSAALEAVIAKALSIVPSDRYESAEAFSAALTGAMAPPVPARVAFPSRRRAWLIAALATVVVGGGAVVAARNGALPMFHASPALDTTRIAVLLPEGADSSLSDHVFGVVYDQTSRWRGINTVDRFRVNELANSSATLTDDRAAAIAQKLGAGRYIRTRFVRDGDAWRVSSTLYDTRARERLFESGVRLSAASPGMDSVLSYLTDSLLLRGVASPRVSSRMLPAVQQYSAGMHHVVDDWDLRAADSLLSKAVEFDPDFASAWLWLAEVRAAMFEPVARWQSAIQRATLGSRLSGRDSVLGTALLALAAGEYARACHQFESMRQVDRRDFIALYGLGQCRRMDQIVIRDPKSPSRWSFRSSEHQAVQAFAEAFEIAPLLHRGVQGDGYAQLRNLLRTDAFNRPGNALPPDTTRFAGFAEWRGDSLSFVPYPYAVLVSARASFDNDARSAALRNQRLLFGRIAHSWAAALPMSPGTIEALAVALELNGERSAVDTLRKARSLTKDATDRIRLAAEEVLMRLEFMGAADSSEVVRIRSLADSLLRFDLEATPAAAPELASIAAIVGRCASAAHLAAMSARGERAMIVSPEVDSIAALLAMGCPAALSSDALAPRLAYASARTADDSARAEYQWLGAAAALTYPKDSARIARLSAVSSDYLLRAEAAALAHDTNGVATILSRQLQRRQNSTQRISADARYYEALAWLAIGDTTNARRWLSPLLDGTRWSPSMAFRPLTVGPTIRGLLLLNSLTLPSEERLMTDRWHGIISALWVSADPPLRALLSASVHR